MSAYTGSNNIVRVPAVQSGNFNLNNLVDFRLPDSADYDFSKSYINFYCEVNTTESNVASGEGIHNLVPYHTDNDRVALYSASVVRNASMSFKNINFDVENIREVGRLRQNLNVFRKTETTNYTKNIDSLYNTVSQNGVHSTNQRQLYRLGDVSSDKTEHPIKVPLKEVYELGYMRNVPCTTWGECVLHLETQFNKLKFREQPRINDDNDYRLKMNDVSATDITNGTNVLTSSHPLDTELSDSPYYVGQKVQLDATNGDGPDEICAEGIIEQIEVVNGYLNITLSANIPNTTENLNSGNGLTNCKLYSVYADSIDDPIITRAELILQLSNNPKPNNKLSYLTYTTEQVSITKRDQLSHMFDLEPECVAVYIMPSDNRLTAKTHGTLGEEHIKNYRLYLNNEMLTDRDVVPHSALYYDRLAMTMLNSNYKLNNLREFYGHINSFEGNSFYRKITVISTPTPITGQTKLLQLDLETETGQGIENFTLYKLVRRQIEF